MKQPANLAYKFRLYPNEEQKQMLNQMIGNARFAWNMMLARQLDHYKETYRFKSKGEYLKANQALKELNSIKKDEEYSFLRILPSRAYNYVHLNLDAAWKKFFKEKAKGAGKPKFKPNRGWQSFQTDTTFTLDYDNRLFEIRKQYIPFKAKKNDKLYDVLNAGGYEKTITVSRSPSHKYFLSISLHDPRKVDLPAPAEQPEAPVGIDWGVKDFACTSDGEVFEKNTAYLRMQKKLHRLQRKASRQYRMNAKPGQKWREIKTSNWTKTQQQIAKLHERIANIRKDFIHQITNDLTERYDLIAIEDLNVKGMSSSVKPKKREDGKGYKQNGKKRKSGLNKNILNHSPHEFKRQLEYKSKWKGGQVVKVDRFFPSSKTCSCCGFVNKELSLKDRQWDCPECGTHHHRDINAALNIRNQAIKTTNQ